MLDSTSATACSPNSTWLVTSRHVMTRFLAYSFWHREKSWRDKTCRACRIARRNTHGATGATRTTRVQERRHSVDWGGHVHLTCSRSYSWDWRKSRTQKTEVVHAITTDSLSSAMLKQARCDTHDKRDTHDPPCVSCRDVMQRNMWNSGLCDVWLNRIIFVAAI